MRIVLAEAMGMCFGVRDAIEIALREASRGPITVLGELVHNPVVVSRLRAAGVLAARTPEEVSTPRVLVSAHGACEAVREALRARGHEVLEATCPLVSRVHLAAVRLHAEGYHVAIVGLEGHTEVRGVVGDLPESTVVLSDDDVDRLRGRARIGVVAQTTQPLPRVLALVRTMRERLRDAEVRLVDTVCQPTKDRQLAAERLAAQVPAVVVVGAAHSNNARELVATCERMGATVRRVAGAEELRDAWFEGVDAAGLTAGTSVPDDVIDAVVFRLSECGRRADEQAGRQDHEPVQDEAGDREPLADVA